MWCPPCETIDIVSGFSRVFLMSSASFLAAFRPQRDDAVCRLTPAPQAYSGKVFSLSDHPPKPFGEFADDVAEQQQRRRPDQRRDEIGDLELPVRHLENPGGQRHRRPQRSEEPADENRG